MKIDQIIEITNAKVSACKKGLNNSISKGFSSDLMSDVLTLDEENFLIITGLANIQLIRTADMADAKAVLLVRGKKATPEMIELAEECEITILESKYSMYKTSGELYSNGLEPIY